MNKHKYSSAQSFAYFPGMSIGNTPMRQLKRWPNIWVKLEYMNDTQTHKIRPAAYIIQDAEQKGLIRRNERMVLVENSGTSMARVLTFMAAQLGYTYTAVLPETYPAERLAMLKLLGANLTLVDCSHDKNAYVATARRMAIENPVYYFLNQTENNLNSRSHYETTGIEIVTQVEAIDAFVCGIGSGGTLSGVGRRIKEWYPAAEVIAVQPLGTNLVHGVGQKHSFAGWSAGEELPILEADLIDRMETVTYEDAVRLARQLIRQDGLMAGLTTFGNIAAAIRTAQRIGTEKTIVTVAHDSALGYLPHYLL